MPIPEAECPNCGESISFSSHPKLGQKMACPHCGERLEVVYLEPIELDFEFEEEEAWDDESYDEDDFEEEAYDSDDY
jgi:lysine biosynthesis protein LysW